LNATGIDKNTTLFMFYDSEDQEELHHSQYFKYVFEQTG